MGESSRSLYERSREHVNDAEKFQEGSHIVKHWMEYHKDEDSRPDFKFKVLESFKYCLSRQVTEAIWIHYAGDELLNIKNEYNANHLSRVVVDEDNFTKKKRQRQEELKELEDKKHLEEFKKAKRKPMKRARMDEVETLPEG